ncbi:histidine kinase [Nocardioides sp. W7]|uniref:sensor histidine kinase n=1 Tax=Nocardioides sp. W7 TaxID=2931390 RepID=UPI001FD518F3|nr:histidine kinase [Nocardioides sp. W7]
MKLPAITSIRPGPVDERGLVDRLRLTLVAAGTFFLGFPALILAILTLLSVALGPLGVGFVLANAVVPATEVLARLHRRLSSALLGEQVEASYAATADRGFLSRPPVWLRDGNRWRDFGFLAFSGTGGFVLSGVPALLLVTPFVHLGGLIIDGSLIWLLTLVISSVCPLVWWVVTPPLVRARARTERGLLGHSRVADLERRVEQVEETRAETLDHSAAEVRRIERDLHDGAQARIAAVGMNVGLAEKLLVSDPAAAAELLREARETTVSALEDLRSVVRGIHPPVLADRGLAGALEALALPFPIPVTLRLQLPAGLPAPVESAAYFAVAECLANTVKHSGAARAWITGEHRDGRLRLVVGDDGRGGADPTSSGLGGVGRRLAAFDGTMTVLSPSGGPTVVTMEVPCRTT